MDKQKFTREIPISGSYDVVVCGGGPAGTAAALAARRQGASVLIIEGQGQLGGMATSGHVSHWLGGRMLDGRWVVEGLFKEFSEEAAEQGAATIPEYDGKMKYSPHGWYLGLHHGIPLDPFGMARYLDEKLTGEGVDVLFHTQAVDAEIENGSISSIVLFNKSGLQSVNCKTVVDATGDADIAARTGCGFVKGTEEDGLMTPVTLEVHAEGVDQDKLSKHIHDNECPRFRELIKGLKEKDGWPLGTSIFISVQLTEKGTMMLNTSRVCGIDGTDGKSVSEGMRLGRQEVKKLMDTVHKHIPGFENARIKSVAPLLGVRETRRIEGINRMTVQDVCDGKVFEDTIGLSSYGWDLPDPKRPSHQPLHEKKVSKPPVTHIPYGIMVPKSIDNLICPGRSVSVERDVLGPLRVMAPVMAMGEAAGIAGAMAVDKNSSFEEVNVSALQKELIASGAKIGWDE